MRILHMRERLLWAWAVTLAIWSFVPFARFAGSWQLRGIGIVLAVAYGGVLALVMRSGFRRLATRPPSDRGIARRLALLPGWMSAPLMACLYMAVPALLVLGSALLFRRLPFMAVWVLCEWLIVACGAGVMRVLAWRAQRGTSS